VEADYDRIGTNYGPWNRGHDPERGFPRQTLLTSLIRQIFEIWTELETVCPNTIGFLQGTPIFFLQRFERNRLLQGLISND
jgi:hypothetical protein